MYQASDDARRLQMDDKLTALARRTGVEEYRLAMFGVMLSTPLLSVDSAAQR